MTFRLDFDKYQSVQQHKNSNRVAPHPNPSPLILLAKSRILKQLRREAKGLLDD